MTTLSNRLTRRRHKKITPAPSSTCRSLQNHTRPKKDDKPIEPPYIPPTHKNNARPLPQPAVPCKITTAQKRMTNRSNRHTRRRHTKITPAPSSTCRSLQNHNRPKKEICYTEPRRTCFCIPYFVSISHTFFNLLRFSPLPRPCLLFLPFLILSRPLPLLCFSFPVIFHIPHFSFIRPLFRFFPPNFPLSHFLCFTFGCPVTAFPFLLCPAGGFSRAPFSRFAAFRPVYFPFFSPVSSFDRPRPPLIPPIGNLTY